jgi:hypothetical protein
VGSYRVTATVAADTNYDTATSSTYSFAIVAAGTTFASWSGNAAVTSDLVYKYAFGAVDKTSNPQSMTSGVANGKLSLTAVVRTDDSKLVITPKSTDSLTGTWSPTAPVIAVTNATDQSGLGTGLVRKVYSVEQGTDSRRFLMLEAVYIQ